MLSCEDVSKFYESQSSVLERLQTTADVHAARQNVEEFSQITIDARFSQVCIILYMILIITTLYNKHYDVTLFVSREL